MLKSNKKYYTLVSLKKIRLSLTCDSYDLDASVTQTLDYTEFGYLGNMFVSGVLSICVKEDFEHNKKRQSFFFCSHTEPSQSL